jgi:hypothetical protein
MTNRKEEYPYCYGILENVFPMGENGLRNTPESCMTCRHKTECLREAMGKREGLKVKEEIVDRAYESGMIGFFSRWSRKKRLQQEKRKADAAVPCKTKPA